MESDDLITESKEKSESILNDIVTDEALTEKLHQIESKVSPGAPRSTETKRQSIKNNVITKEKINESLNQIEVKVSPGTTRPTQKVVADQKHNTTALKNSKLWGIKNEDIDAKNSSKSFAKTSWIRPDEASEISQYSDIECLLGLDKVVIDNKIEISPELEKLPYSILNHYVVRSESKQKCFLALEESSTFSRCCWGRTRGFKIHLFDKKMNEVLLIQRKSLFCACCAHLSWFTCWGNSCIFATVVKNFKGELLGEIRQSKSCFQSSFEIFNEDLDLSYRIQGPFCLCNCTCCSCNDHYRILAKRDNLIVGEILKQKGIGPDGKSLRKIPSYVITYPNPCNLKMKAVLLASTFVIDVMYYESMRSYD